MKWRRLLIGQGQADTITEAQTHARASALTCVSNLFPQDFPYSHLIRCI